jgi:SAM-dependent methyltransferase
LRSDVQARERAFWDEHVPSLDHCIAEYRAGPDPNTKLMLDALEPLAGARVLDFACGTGVVSAWLADRGASVTGIDLSASSIDRARELLDHLGARASFVAGALAELARESPFDRIAGRYALHHVDCETVAPALAQLLRPAGTAAFVETMAANRLLAFLRSHVAGRFGVPRYGTRDERPLGAADVAALEDAFAAPVRTEVAELTFLRVLDRQITKFRVRSISRALGAIDDLLLRAGRDRWSYHQVVIVTKPGS